MNLAFRFLGVTAACLIVQAQEKNLRVSIEKEPGDGLKVAIHGSPGLHRVENKEDLRSPDWKSLRDITSETNLIVSAGSARSFIRAQAAPEHDLSVFTNSMAMLQTGAGNFQA